MSNDKVLPDKVLKEIDAYYNEEGKYLVLTAYSERAKLGDVKIEDIDWKGTESILTVLNSLSLLESWYCTKKKDWISPKKGYEDIYNDKHRGE